MYNKNLLNNMWSKETKDGKDAMVIAFFFCTKRNKNETLDNDIDTFLKIIPAKRSLVRYHLSLLRETKESFFNLENTSELGRNPDCDDVLGVTPYFDNARRTISDNSETFNKSRELFNKQYDVD